MAQAIAPDGLVEEELFRLAPLRHGVVLIHTVSNATKRHYTRRPTELS